MAELKNFIAEQKQLRFLGLMLTEACKDEMFQGPGTPMVVSGSANEAQVLESLQRYLGRQHYIKKSLSHLFGLTQGYSVPRVDIIRVICLINVLVYLCASLSKIILVRKFCLASTFIL
jgi:Zyg-11 protein homolog